MKIDLIRSLARWYLKDKTLSKEKIDMQNVNNILVMSNTAIGDTLFATPAIQLIKEYYPNKRIVALLNPKNFKLFSTNPNIDEIVTFRGKWRCFLQAIFKLRSKNIDLTFIFHSNEPQATPLAYLSGSKHIIKITNEGNEFNFLHYNSPIAPRTDEHFIDRRLKQLEYIGINKKSYEMQLFPDRSWYVEVDKVINQNIKYIGLQVGASTKSRMWPIERWIELAQKVLDYDDSICVVLTGSPEEEHLTQNVEEGVNNIRLLNLAGKFNICSAAALIEALDFLITPDTGPLHVAAALKTPTIAISVAGVASSSNPIDKQVPHIFIEKPKTCNPCIDKRCKNAFCMDQISVDEVFLNVIKLL